MKAAEREPFGAPHVARSPMTANYVRVLLRTFSDGAESQAKLLRGTGLETGLFSKENDTIELRQYLTFTDNLARVHPDWGLRVNPVTYITAHGAAGVALLSAPTLGDALRVAARFSHLRAPYFRLEAEEDSKWFALRIIPRVDLHSDLRRSLLESLLLSYQGAIEAALQRPMREGMFDIAGLPRPKSFESAFREAFHAPVRFDQPTSAVLVPRAWLGTPCPVADAAQHRHALIELESAERQFEAADGVLRDVVDLLAESVDLDISLGQVAAKLGLSRRTLERRLSDSGASFRGLVQEVRRRSAEELLADETLTTTEIAYQLGYADPANFGRACHRWFGMSPHDYRREVLGHGDGES